MSFIHRAVVKGNLSCSAVQIYEENVVLFRPSRRSQEEKFPYAENPFLLSCDMNMFCVVLYSFCCMELHVFRNCDLVDEIDCLFKVFRVFFTFLFTSMCPCSVTCDRAS
jgi:hypothetical protein